VNVSLEYVISLVASVLEIDPSAIDPSAEADAIDSWDSLRHLAIITAVEDAFQIELTMDVIAEIDSVSALHQAISESVPAV